MTDRGGRPLAGAELRLDDVVIGVTDKTGQFLLTRKPWPAVAQTLSAGLPGFAKVSRSVQLPSEDAPGLVVVLKLARERVVGRRDVERGGKPNYMVIPVFYVTDRRDTGNSDPTLRYSSERSHTGEIAHGICEVSIPSTHHTGSLENPSWMQFEFRPDPNKHVVLRSVRPLGIEPFYQRLDAKLRAASSKEVVVFIHGYKNDFGFAARQAAQMTVDLPFDGAPILYSWPSKDSLFAYTEDEDTVEWTTFHLRPFLEELGQRTQAARIHIVAHSMGNRALAKALQLIAAKRLPSQKPLFHQVILAAPDIDAETLDLFAREIRPVTERITLYASANDDALLLSKFIHGGLRAGEKGKYLLITPGVDTIDASAARTDFIGHRYFSNSGSIIDDIHKLLSNQAPPELRNLIPAFLQNLKYWIMPTALSPAAHPAEHP